MTTLARLYAHALGCSAASRTFVKVDVQAHWVDDASLLAAKYLGGLCEQLSSDQTGLGVALLDEMNLARPEFYLTRWLLALDDDAGHAHDPAVVLPRTPTGVPRIVTIGTLNIDEWSRPPADKILDRAFLIEPDLDSELGSGAVRWIAPPSRVSAEQWQRWATLEDSLPALPPEVEDLVAKLRLHDSQHARSIHESMQPSRRGVHDVRKLVAFWERIDGNETLLARSELFDRAVAARIVPKFRGDARAWAKLIGELKAFFRECNWRRCARHLEIMDRQREEGFVSFWG
jgi:hypothetical protein